MGHGVLGQDAGGVNMAKSMCGLGPLGVVALVGLVGCGVDPTGDGFVTGSNNVVARGDYVYVADMDNGALARVQVSTGDVRSLVLGAEPARVVRLGNRLYVTVRAERSVAVVEEAADGSMTVVEMHEVGAEPFGIVASPDGKDLFVALSMEDAVVRLNVSNLAEQQRYPVADEPRWLAITPNGRYVYVGSAMRGTITQIDVRSGQSKPVQAPPVERGDMETGEIVLTVPRVTGDPAISEDGTTLAVPLLYVDVVTSVGPADPTTEGGFDPDLPPERGGGGGYAAGNVEGLTRFNPAVVTFPLGSGGDVQIGGARAMLVSGAADLDGVLTEPLISEDFASDEMERFDTGFGGVEQGAFTRVRGYLSSLAFSEDGHVILAAVEGGRSIAAIASVPVEQGQPFNGNDFGFDDDVFMGDGAFESTPRVFIGTGDGPQGIVRLDDGRIATYSFIGRALSAADYDDIFTSMEVLALGKAFNTITWTAQSVAKLSPSILPPGVQEGRRLFYSSNDSSMAAAGAGVSCATCHFDGRNDGLTWSFDHAKRQTPSLAGPVSRTAPITWSNGVGTIEEEVRITSQGRMGGHGLTVAATLDVASYIDFTRDVDVQAGKVDHDAIARGKAVFERPDTACATCHTGERLTDNRFYPMVGEAAVNTPGLIGLKATAPYFHDGRAQTLQDVVEQADAVGMGHTAHLDGGDKADLVAYLRSL
jgi:mono/diheme cytochrome c family protein